MTLTVDEQVQLERVLAQDRSALIFTEYEASAQHKARVDGLGSLQVRREEWLSHSGWGKRHQMPTYHIHFRQEMQDVLHLLSEFYASTKRDTRLADEADSRFVRFQSGLHGHVRLEETYYFPNLKAKYPRIDLSFLYADHARLHEFEREVLRGFKGLQTIAEYGSIEREDKADMIRKVLTFDQCLVNHLGEEEDIVVPLTLRLK
jgi:hemerythrin-like domain-containing protein